MSYLIIFLQSIISLNLWEFIPKSSPWFVNAFFILPLSYSVEISYHLTQHAFYSHYSFIPLFIAAQQFIEFIQQYINLGVETPYKELQC